MLLHTNFKDEMVGDILIEFVGVHAKYYNLLLDPFQDRVVYKIRYPKTYSKGSGYKPEK